MIFVRRLRSLQYKIKSSKEALIYYDYGHEYLPGYSDRAFQFMMGFLTEEEKMV